MRNLGAYERDGQRHDVSQRHRVVSIQTLVFWRHFSGPVLELPRRVREDGRVSAAARRTDQTFPNAFAHDLLQSEMHAALIPTASTGHAPFLPALSRYRSLPIQVVLAPYLASVGRG